MTNDKIELLIREIDDRIESDPEPSSAESAPDGRPEADRTDYTDGLPPRGVRLDRSFASEYLDELVIAILFRREEANGMDIIREFTQLFGVQFSPGTVYPHLHSLEEEGVLERRDCVRTKEYRIDDRRAAREYLESTVAQLSHMRAFLDAAPREDGPQDSAGQDSAVADESESGWDTERSGAGRFTDA